jgi:predicted ArsR family transcriptional regulator
VTPRKPVSSPKPGAVTLLTNQAYVLMYLAERPVTTLSAIAQKLRVTERAIQRIIGQLADQGFVTRTRDGQRIHYMVHTDKTIRHPMVGELSVGSIMKLARQSGRPVARDSGASPRSTAPLDQETNGNAVSGKERR